MRRRSISRFDLRKIGKSLFDTWRKRNIIVVINDDDFRGWRKGLGIINISISQGFVSHLFPIKINLRLIVM
jgi:hypothetical protein